MITIEDITVRDKENCLLRLGRCALEL